MVVIRWIVVFLRSGLINLLEYVTIIDTYVVNTH